ncbi:MAG: CDP-diacylglycerol--glycerol-3-phosphate 3-phosphatidyltransferase [bacterium]
MILPNQLTVLRIILTPIFFILFLQDSNLAKQISVVVFVIAAITDWYDGWLARKFNYITSWGKFMDPLADKILTSAAFLGFVFIGVLPLWMVLVIIIRDFLITGLRSFAEYKKKSFYTSRSAKIKTFVQMAYIYYLLMIFALKTIDVLYVGNEKLFELLLDKDMVYYSMFGITIFTVFTGITYIFKNRFLIKGLYAANSKQN